MRHVVRLNVGEPQERVAALYSDPRNNPKWMHDVDRCEPLSGEPGAIGSTYRLVPREGQLEFVGTVVSRRLPSEVKLLLDAPSLSVAVTATFEALPGDRTLLVSEQHYTFKGWDNKLRGFLARPAIASAHKRHMAAFRTFAESRL